MQHKNEYDLEQNGKTWMAWKRHNEDGTKKIEFEGTKTNLDKFLKEKRKIRLEGAAKAVQTRLNSPAYRAKRRQQIPAKIKKLKAEIAKLELELEYLDPDRETKKWKIGG